MTAGFGGTPATPGVGGVAPGFAGGRPAGFSCGLAWSPPCGVLATPAGGGGAPLAPGTGNVLVNVLVLGGSLNRPCPGGGMVGGTVAGTTGAVVPGFAAGTFARLGGGGSLPCWISITRCWTFLGSCGVAVVVWGGGVGVGVPGPGVPSAGAPEAGAAGGGWLMTFLMTVGLWMLLKMMLFGGGAT